MLGVACELSLLLGEGFRTFLEQLSVTVEVHLISVSLGHLHQARASRCRRTGDHVGFCFMHQQHLLHVVLAFAEVLTVRQVLESRTKTSTAVVLRHSLAGCSFANQSMRTKSHPWLLPCCFHLILDVADRHLKRAS